MVQTTWYRIGAKHVCTRDTKIGMFDEYQATKWHHYFCIMKYRNIQAPAYQYDWSCILLTLKEPEYFGDLKAGGGLNQPTTVFVLLYSQFPWKSFIKGLKWKLASLSTCRVFEHHPKLHSFAMRWRRSSLLWPRKFSSFRYYNFWKVVIFDLHGQYVYQMKAENILNSNLT